MIAHPSFISTSLGSPTVTKGPSIHSPTPDPSSQQFLARIQNRAAAKDFDPRAAAAVAHGRSGLVSIVLVHALQDHKGIGNHCHRRLKGQRTACRRHCEKKEFWSSLPPTIQGSLSAKYIVVVIALRSENCPFLLGQNMTFVERGNCGHLILRSDHFGVRLVGPSFPVSTSSSPS